MTLGNNEFVPRCFTPPEQHFFLFGPRGTGKTSWCAHAYPDALRIDLLDAQTFSRFCVQANLLVEMAQDAAGQGAARKPIVIDEIQKLPALLDDVRLLIGRNAALQFIFPVSSTNKLRRQEVDLLSGHAVQKQLHPYMAAELGGHFKLETALRQGMLPIVWAERDANVSLHACNSFYLHEELQIERRMRDPTDFIRFLEAMSLVHASVLDLPAVAADCGIDRQTVEGFMDILEDLLLGFRLQAFTQRRRLPKPKFYFFDTGIFHANRPTGLMVRAHELDWAALEGLVAQHLRAWCDYSAGRHRLYYWQGRGLLEVDFIVYGESGLYALDVKNSKSVREEDLRALNEFSKKYPRSRRYLLYRGSKRFQHEHAVCVPCEEFLLQLRPGRFPG